MRRNMIKKKFLCQRAMIIKTAATVPRIQYQETSFSRYSCSAARHTTFLFSLFSLFILNLLCARGRTRTDTSLRTTDLKSVAATNYATRAIILHFFESCFQRYITIQNIAIARAPTLRLMIRNGVETEFPFPISPKLKKDKTEKRKLKIAKNAAMFKIFLL